MDPDALGGGAPPAAPAGAEAGAAEGGSALEGGSAVEAGGALLFQEDFETYPLAERWLDDSLHGPWHCAYAGGGASGIERTSTQVHSLQPEGGSGSALTVTTRADFADIDLTVRVATLQQTRPQPDRTDSATILWRYDEPRDVGVYLSLGPGGWDLGTRSGGRLASVAAGGEACAVGETCTLRVRDVAGEISIEVAGRKAGAARVAPPNAKGQIGLYVDAAHVHFDDLFVLAP